MRLRSHSSFSASATTAGWRTSPFSTAPWGSGTWAARMSTGTSPPPTSAARTAVGPMSRPTRVLAPYAPPPLTPTPGEVLVPVRLTDPEVLSHPDGRQLAALDESVDGHVRDPHRRRHLAHGEEPVPHERPSLAHALSPHAATVTFVTSLTSAPSSTTATSASLSYFFHSSCVGSRTVTSTPLVVNHPCTPLSA